MEEKIQNSKSEKLLGVTIDNKLSFTEHVHKICDTTSQKLNALAQLSSFMSLEKRELVMKALIHNLDTVFLFGCSIIDV